MTRQEIFNTVWHHMIKQGVWSVNDEGTCLYRGPNGTSCAVGCLLTDEEAADITEGKNVRNIVLPGRLNRDLNFLEDLQRAHDEPIDALIFLEQFQVKMRRIAVQYELTVPAGQSETTQGL